MPHARSRILLSLFVLAAIFGSIYWLVAAEALRDGLDRWADRQRADGFEVGYDPPSTSGYPWAIAVTVADPFLVAPQGDWEWRGERLSVSVDPWIGDAARVDASGVHRFAHRVERRNVDLILGRTDLTIRFDRSDRVQGGELELADSAVVLPNDLAVSIGEARASAEMDRRIHGREVGVLRADAARIDLPPGIGGPLGDRIAAVRVSARAHGELAVLAGRGALAGRLDRWRLSGGQIEISRLDIDWSGLELTAAGSVVLNEDLQPRGRLDAEIYGYEAIVDGLVAAGRLTEQQGVVGKLALGLIARRKPGEDRPFLAAPVFVEAGHLRLGPVQLMPVPIIEWP